MVREELIVPREISLAIFDVPTNLFIEARILGRMILIFLAVHDLVAFLPYRIEQYCPHRLYGSQGRMGR